MIGMETIYIIAVSTLSGFCTACSVLGLACLLDMSGLTTITRRVVRPLHSSARPTVQEPAAVQKQAPAARAPEPTVTEPIVAEPAPGEPVRPIPDAAYAALRQLYNGAVLDLDAAEALFKHGTTKEVRERLGYVDGRDWYDNTPIGLLFAEEQVAKKSESDGFWAKEKVVKPYAEMAMAFRRYDLVAMLLLDGPGRTIDTLPLDPSDVLRGQGSLPENLFDQVVRQADRDLLNLAIRYGTHATTLCHGLILGVDVPPRRLGEALNRLVDAGAEYVASIDDGERRGLTEKVLKEARARVQVVAANRAKQAVIDKANAYTPMEMEEIALRAAVEEAQAESRQVPPVSGPRKRL